MTSIEIHWPWDKPHLSPNRRMHHQQRARFTSQLRRTAAWLALDAHNRAGNPAISHVDVRMHYRPVDNRRRDEDNLTMDLKAFCDGVVDSGRWVPDDTPRFMRKHMPILHPAAKGKPARIWFEVTW